MKIIAFILCCCSFFCSNGAIAGADNYSIASSYITPTISTPPSPTTSCPPSKKHLRFDFNGDGSDDNCVFRPLNDLWAIRNLTRTYYGNIENIPWPADLDGDGSSDINLFKNGRWATLLSGSGSQRHYFGTYGDLPVADDFRGAGTSSIAIFRQSSGLWAIKGLTRLYFGQNNDIPISGDYDGDGTCDPGLFRPENGLWAIRGITRSYFGMNYDIPVPADYYGDGTEVIAIFRPSSGFWAIQGLTRLYFGRDNDIPVPGDYGGDGTCNPGIFRPENGLWAIRGTTRFYFGKSSDLPFPLGYGNGLLVPTTIMAYGDTRTGDDIHRIHIENMLTHKPACILHTGDMVDSESAWSAYTEIIQPVKDILYPCIGNHDHPREIYYSIYSYLYPDISSLYYSFNLNNIHIVSLDTNLNKITSQELDWLENNLKDNKESEWKVVFFHHPPYSAGHHGSDIRVRTNIVPILEKYNVDLAVSGHNHCYDRSVSIRNDQEDDTGIIYLTLGGGRTVNSSNVRLVYGLG